MYLESIPENVKTTTVLKIKYDCHDEERTMKWCDANENFQKNNGKHICRKCWLKSDANPSKNKKIRDKIKKTNLDRYGVENPLNTPKKIAERAKKFEDKEFKQSWVEKHRKTSLEKYGVDHPMKTEEVQAIQKQAMQEKYGVDHPYQSPEIMAKMKANNLKKYGVENVAALPEVQLKMAKTTLEKYGVEHYNQLPEMKDYLREHCKEWLADSYNDPWAKGITRPEEWNKKARETIATRILSGKWNGGFKSNCRGRFPSPKCKKQNPRFLSSLELIFHYYLTFNTTVEWYDYECLSIPYKKEDMSDHLYFPDFLVKFINDDCLYIFEIKAWQEKDSINVKLKQSAAEIYANKNNMKYCILFDEDINKLGIKLETIRLMPGIMFETKKDLE